MPTTTTSLFLPATDSLPPITFISPSTALRNKSCHIILPGGGYQKVMVVKEGTKIGEHYASKGVCSFVVDYPIGKRGFLSTRAESCGGIIQSVVNVLQFVRDLCTSTDPRFGDLDINLIGLTGFSAGGHLSLCVLSHDNGNLRSLTGSLNPLHSNPPTNKYPKINNVVLVYPTLRSPTCWCIAGGLWPIPSMFGKSFKPSGEHLTCFTCNDSTMGSLIESMPSNIMCVTVAGDLLLPSHKHSDILIKCIKSSKYNTRSNDNHSSHSSNVVYERNVGPWWLYHGCGLHVSWSHSVHRFLEKCYYSNNGEGDEGHDGDEVDEGDEGVEAKDVKLDL
jgi:hypothetical protein